MYKPVVMTSTDEKRRFGDPCYLIYAPQHVFAFISVEIILFAGFLRTRRYKYPIIIVIDVSEKTLKTTTSIRDRSYPNARWFFRRHTEYTFSARLYYNIIIPLHGDFVSVVVWLFAWFARSSRRTNVSRFSLDAFDYFHTCGTLRYVTFDRDS